MLPLVPSAIAKNEFSLGENFKAHCIECHGSEGKVKGEVNLFSFTQGRDIKSDPKLLQAVMEVIDFGKMSPEEKQPIDNTERKIMVTHSEKLLEESVSETSEEWENAPIRRMTRFQYANAVKDLLELKVKVFPLPEKMTRD